MESLQPQKDRSSLSIDYRIICVVLVLIIAGMLALWQPWQGVSDRTVEVTGQATVTAVPDEFVFTPAYDFKNANKEAALAALTAKSNDIVAKLKELGVADNSIKTNSDSYSYPTFKDDTNNVPTYTLRLTVTLGNKDLSQKVQDYLLATAPTGSVTPQATFSDKKRSELENKARDEATKDARAKAEQSAKNLGFSLGAVKTVNDGAGFGVLPFRGNAADTTSVGAPESLPLQPGENELTYSVTVVYFVR